MSERLAFGRATFASLAVPNYRRYFTGQAISMVGTWMQTVAQSWLVLQLTGSGTAVGLVAALQALPVLALGSYGGLVADRVDKRRLMMALQAAMGVLALGLGLLIVTHEIRIWHVYVFATLLGANKAFESPARQTFVLELVGPRDLRNAISLNSVLQSAARAGGAAAAGVVIAVAGTGVCFLVNAGSFVAVVASLALVDVDELIPVERAVRARGQLRAGLRYAVRTRGIGVPLAMVALTGCLAYEFQVVLPVVAKQSFHGDAATYGFMTSAMGVGAVFGGLYAATRGRTGLRPFAFSSLLFGGVIGLAAVSPTLPVILVVLTFVGAASVSFRANGNTLLQLTAEPAMRGRVMGLWSVALTGSTPIGGPIAGAVSEHIGARWGLVLGAAACAVAGLFGMVALRRDATTRRLEEVRGEVPLDAADSGDPLPERIVDAVDPA